jgi:hypothetical protein
MEKSLSVSDQALPVSQHKPHAECSYNVQRVLTCLTTGLLIRARVPDYTIGSVMTLQTETHNTVDPHEIRLLMAHPYGFTRVH